MLTKLKCVLVSITVPMILMLSFDIYEYYLTILDGNTSRSLVPTRDSPPCVCHRSDIKIFNIGFPKSGTASLQQLLLKMGCKSIHWRVYNDINAVNKSKLMNANHWNSRFGTNISKARDDYSVAKLMQFAKEDNKPYLYYFADDINSITQMDMCHKFQKSYCLWPQLIDFKELDKQYPYSFFIIMHRNITKHIISINNWNNMRQRIIQSDIPYLPSGEGRTDEEMEFWIKNHYENVKQYFSSNDALGHFLAYHIENDNVEKLEDFLGCDHKYKLSHVHNTATRNRHK